MKNALIIALLLGGMSIDNVDAGSFYQTESKLSGTTRQCTFVNKAKNIAASVGEQWSDNILQLRVGHRIRVAKSSAEKFQEGFVSVACGIGALVVNSGKFVAASISNNQQQRSSATDALKRGVAQVTTGVKSMYGACKRIWGQAKKTVSDAVKWCTTRIASSKLRD